MKSTPDSTIIDGPEYIAVHIGGLATYIAACAPLQRTNL